jgi:intraflagellar transport protein 52
MPTKFSALKTFLDRGGSILYLAGEGGEASYPTNFNYLLEEYGMMVNPGISFFLWIESKISNAIG